MKMSQLLIQRFQREKEDALIELERRKEELDKERTTNKIISEEKDMNNKEFERLLEKYDRYEDHHKKCYVRRQISLLYTKS